MAGTLPKINTTCQPVSLMYVYMFVSSFMHIWQRLKNIGHVKGPGGLFATRLVTESGGLATDPPCDKPIEDYSTVHRGPRQGFVTEGARQRFVAGGEAATNPYSSQRHYMYTYLV